MKQIPPAVAEAIAKNFDFDQILIIGRERGDNGGDQVIFCGKTERDANIIHEIAEFIKDKVLCWAKEAEAKMNDVNDAGLSEGPDNVGRRLIYLPGRD